MLGGDLYLYRAVEDNDSPHTQWRIYEQGCHPYCGDVVVNYETITDYSIRKDRNCYVLSHIAAVMGSYPTLQTAIRAAVSIILGEES